MGRNSSVQRTSEVAFCGDTTFEVIRREEHLRSARRLILECTFLDERITPDQARSRGHVHLDQIAEDAELFRGVGALLITHLSARYAASEARAILDERLPGWLREKTVLFAS